MDILKYKVEVPKHDTQQPKFTKRNVLSQVATIYDPIGFAAPYLVRAKIGLQELWQKGLEWDDDLSPSDQLKWLLYFKEMEQLNQISLEKCLYPVAPAELPTLCVFADASREAFGTCAYLRNEEPTRAVSKICCSQVTSGPTERTDDSTPRIASSCVSQPIM